MEHRFWKDKWDAGTLGFHRDEVHPSLVAHAEAVFGKGASVLVPLCGKSWDLRWLAEQMGGATGIEFVEKAVTSFFEEWEREPAVDGDQWHADNVRIVCRDVLEVDFADLGTQGIWDRAAMTALPPTAREPYVAKIRQCLDAGSTLLLNVLEYDPTVMGGPPYSFSEEQVRHLYEGYTIGLLDRVDLLPLEPRWAAKGHQIFNSVTYQVAQG